MSVVLAMRAKAAAAVRARLEGKVYEHSRARFGDVPDEDVAAEGPAQIVRMVEKIKPLAVAVDITLGGQRYMAMDAVRMILDDIDAPAVVLIVPHLTLPLARHAWEIGVYDAIEVSDRPSAGQIQKVGDAVYRAIAWKDGLGAQRLPWLSDLERAAPKRAVSSSRPPAQRRRRQAP